MKRWFTHCIAMAVASVLAVGCGGGAGSGDPLPGGGDTPTVTVSDLVVTLDKTTIANTGSETVGVTVTAIDSKRNVVASAPITITADEDAIVTASGATTGADGTVTATVSIGSNRANRVVTVTAVSGDVRQTATFQVAGAKLVATLVPAIVAPSAAGQVQYRLTDQSGSPMVGQPIVVTAAGFTPTEATGVTGANGDFVYSYTSAPAAAGNQVISASAGGVSDSQTLVVQGGAGTVDPAAPSVISASVSANPSVVGVNAADSSSNRSEIRALFLGAGNVPSQRVRVRFDLNGDVNAIGGTFTTGSEMLYSDGNGVVTTAYVPGTRSSPTNGVTIRACYSATDFAAGACPNSALVTLTVTSEPLGVSIGTNEQIIVNELTFVKKFIVSVVDSAGRAKADVDLVVSLDLPRYRKGFYVAAAAKWDKSGGADAVICANEDVNRNGVLESGEDLDSDGRLDPGKSDVSVALLQAKTRADGTAELQIQYAKSFGSWVDAVITVAASGVAGTEGRATYVVQPVPVDAASIGNTAVQPAYLDSPYGNTASCTDEN